MSPTRRKAYVQFELDTVPENFNAAAVKKATLRLFAAKIGAPGALKVSAAGDGVTPFDEATITGSNSPATGNEIAGIVFPAKGEECFRYG
jgi:hypothetical protein